jgi:hypothetical protein
MTDPFIFDRGTRVDTGSHGETDLCYAAGDPVTDDGDSSLAFESGTGLSVGGQTITGRLLEPDGTEITELSVTDPNDLYGDSVYYAYYIRGNDNDYRAWFTPATGSPVQIEDFNPGWSITYNNRFTAKTGRNVLFWFDGGESVGETRTGTAEFGDGDKATIGVFIGIQNLNIQNVTFPTTGYGFQWGNRSFDNGRVSIIRYDPDGGTELIREQRDMNPYVNTELTYEFTYGG